MPDQVVSYKCPCCGAPLRYSGLSDALKCDSCGNRFELDALKQAQAVADATQEQAMEWEGTGNDAWQEGETEHLRTYSCPSCGAEIVVDDTTAATECVYCGNSSIMPGVVSGDFRPDAVLPFVKTKEEAVAAYKELIKGKKLLPKQFSSRKLIDKITGVYVPFWLFECKTDSALSFRASRTMTHSNGKEMITNTDHFLVLRGGRLDFSGVPVDASTKFDDTLMEAVEPFDTTQLKPFETGYLSGYQAERYDVDAETAEPRANERIRNSVVETFSATVGAYTGVALQSANINLLDKKRLNVLAPVWMLNKQWNGQTYTFAMNGQTGKLVGNLPVDKSAAWKWRLGIFFGAFAGTTLIALLLSLLGVI